MIINIQDDILILHNHGILKRLLEDKTTKKNIMWATDAYNDFGVQYYRNEEIKAELITGRNSDIIKTRARKELEKQFERTRQRAEVFTPLWICKRMNDDAERFWLEDNVAASETGEYKDYMELVLNDDKLFKKYIDSKRLEITCGEAPYLVSRYDVATGEMIPVGKRIGILDRKLQAVGIYAENEEEWFKWVIRAYQATFGYEFQGDNVLIARVNLLMSLAEYMEDRWGRKPTDREYEKVANIVSWNIWQMDGLTYTIPYSKAEEHVVQLDIFGFLQDEDESELQDEETVSIQPYCRIYDWHNKKKSIEFQELRKGMHMKFDFIIGNPPYQSDVENKGDRANPIYDKFMDSCFEISDVVELIHPARFLFNAGQTPKTWNDKMLSDEHYKVLFYEPKSAKVFPNTDIKGGVAISYRNANINFGAIGTFTAFEELNSIIKKVRDVEGEREYIDSIVSSRGLYRFSKDFYEDYPQARSLVGAGSGNMIVSNAFDKLSEAFPVDPGDDSEDYIKILGRTRNDRTWRYIKRKYVIENEYIDTYNIIVPEANGTGAIGEILSTPLIGEPLIGEPLIGATDTFISIGTFSGENEAEAAFKYIKSRFARTMLGVNKVTQHNPKSVWRDVPLQDFTQTSDIDWSQSISDVDRQLYAKYGLDQNEIDFIESHVKEMK